MVRGLNCQPLRWEGECVTTAPPWQNWGRSKVIGRGLHSANTFPVWSWVEEEGLLSGKMAIKGGKCNKTKCIGHSHNSVYNISRFCSKSWQNSGYNDREQGNIGYDRIRFDWQRPVLCEYFSVIVLGCGSRGYTGGMLIKFGKSNDFFLSSRDLGSNPSYDKVMACFNVTDAVKNGW